MPRITRTLWFEDVGFMNEPILDTPVGRLTIRQTLGLALFAFLAWVILQAPLSFIDDLIFRVAVAGTVFTAGVIIFTRKVRTVTPEKGLLLALGLGKKRAPRLPKAGKRKGKVFGAPVPARTVRVQAGFDAPVKIVGVLRDLSTGRLMPNRPFEVHVEGRLLSRGVSDEQGFFSVYFMPQRYGVFRVEVRPEGYAGPAQTLEVQVQAQGGAALA